MPKQLTEEDKKRVYDILAEAYIDLISKQLIGPYERKVLSYKILQSVGKAETFEEVSGFVSSLLASYPVFQNASVRIASQIGKLHEEQLIGRLQQFIQTA